MKTIIKYGMIGILFIVFLLKLLPVSNAKIIPNSTRSAFMEQKKITGMTLRKEKAYAEIERRITGLNNLITRINNVKRLTTDQKSSLISQVNAEITNLTTLKSQIESDTEVASLMEHKKSIVSSYRIFVFFMPKIQIIAHADKILNLAEEMNTKTTNTDALAKISEATTQAQNAINIVVALDPSGWPGNKLSLESARGMLKTSREDLKAARELMKPQ